MSKTLHLLDRVLERGRNLQSIGRRQDALELLGRLGRWQNLPPVVAEEVLSRLAAMKLEREDFAGARRQLTAVLKYNPFNPLYHYQMAVALEQDDEPDLERALDYYRQSLQLDPNQPRCLSDFGLACISASEEEEGLQALGRAVELAPDNVETVRALVGGLCELERWDDARVVIEQALFRNSRSALFHKLWSDFQFQECHAKQNARYEAILESRQPEKRWILPFERPKELSEPPRTVRLRRDVPSRLKGPHMPLPSDSPGRKHA
jgi:tetratricopeptide (TPR) repeat protein